MKRISKLFVGFIFSLLLIFLMLSMTEMKLEHSNTLEWSDKYKQVRPYYWWSSHTHDGTTIGTTRGPLKLALHPFVIYTNLPNQKTDHFSINSLGFRGTEILQERKIKKRMIVVGGSSAFGTGLENDDETFERQLENILNVEVINAAVIGHASGQELVYLLTELVDLKPDLVITFDGWNDYWRANETKTYKLMGVNGFDQIEDQLKIFRSLTDSSFLVRATNLYWVLFPRITNRIKYSRLGNWRDGENLTGQPDLDLAGSVYAKNIIKMKKVSQSFHYNFMCVLQPAKERDKNYHYFRNAAKKYFARENLMYLDLNDPEYEIKAERFMDQMHLDGVGNKLIAEIIAKKIIAERLFRDVHEKPR